MGKPLLGWVGLLVLVPVRTTLRWMALECRRHRALRTFLPMPLRGRRGSSLRRGMAGTARWRWTGASSPGRCILVMHRNGIAADGEVTLPEVRPSEVSRPEDLSEHES